MSFPRHAAGIAAFAVVLLLAMGDALAARWEWNPRVQAGYQYDDNYRLDLPGNEIEVSGVAADARLELRYTGPLTEVQFTPRIRSTYFPDQPTEDSNDYFLRMDLQHTRQKLRAALLASVGDETVVRSELPDTDFDSGLGESGGADAGRVQILNRRQMLRVAPSLSYDLSERRSVELSARYVDVQFDEYLPGAQVGYYEAGATAGFSWAMSPRTRVTVRGVYSYYDPEDESTEASGQGLQVEWTRNTSETTEMYLRAGAQRTDFEDATPSGSGSEVSFVAGFGVRRDFRQTSLFIDATHDVGPTASGYIVNREQLRLRVTHAFSPRFSGFVGVRGIHDEAVESDAAFETRSYAIGELGLEWRMTRQFSVAANYDYSWQEFQNDPADARSQGGWLSFIYQRRRN